MLLESLNKKEDRDEHNKKRNTAFLYECLIRELTKAIIKENKEQQRVVKSILKEFFLTGKPSGRIKYLHSLLESKELNNFLTTFFS